MTRLTTQFLKTSTLEQLKITLTELLQEKKELQVGNKNNRLSGRIDTKVNQIYLVEKEIKSRN